MTLTIGQHAAMAPDTPLRIAAETTPTALWNDSADPVELAQSIAFGAVGATCNPVIAVTAIKQHIDVWGRRIQQLALEHPAAGESELGWLVVQELSIQAAELLEPIFHETNGITAASRSRPTPACTETLSRSPSRPFAFRSSPRTSS